MPLWVCTKCGCKVPHIKIFPIRCACGHIETQEISFGKSLTQQYKLITLEEDRRVSCMCCSAYRDWRCDKIDAGCRSSFVAYINDPNSKCPLNRWDNRDIEFITYEQMVSITRNIIGQLSDNISAVVGIPRSGMLSASLLSTAMHLPLYSIKDSKLQFVGGGYRSPKDLDKIQKIILVDDSVSTGFRMSDSIKKIQEQLSCEIETVGIFVSPDATFYPNIVGRWLQSPHWFEWNLLNAITSTYIVVDMDGVICEDTFIEELHHLEFGISRAKPLTVPKLIPIRAIISARLKIHQEITTKWLQDHGAKYHNLILSPWSHPNERTIENVVEFKSQEYIKCGARLFIESDDVLAQKIAKRTNKPVLCWANQKLYQAPKKQKPVLVFLSEVFNMGGVEQWTIQICEQAKKYWDCVIAVPHYTNCAGIMIKAIQEHARVITGKQLCNQLCTDADLVITWGGIGTRNTVLQRTKPVIFVSHLSGQLGAFHARHWFDYSTIKIAVSRPAAQVFIDQGFLPDRIIHYAIDPRNLTPLNRVQNAILTIGYVGRYCESKNYTMAAQVGKKLNCNVIYMGPGKPATIERLKDIYSDVKILRPRLNVSTAYQQIDIFIQASPFETGPLTSLEAMYCGTKVVSTPVGMLAELQENYGKMAEEVTLNPTVDDVILAIEKAQQDDETWKHAQKVIQENYTLDKMVPKWLKLFESVLDGSYTN